MGGNCIVVLSGHRCGSSAVAGVLHKLGVPMGRRLMGKSPANPAGHFEDPEFVGFHKQMVADWRRPDPDLDCCRDAYLALVRRRERQDLWGVKDPRLAFCLPLLREFARCELRLVRMCRDPQMAAYSLEARGRANGNSAIHVDGRGLAIAMHYEAAMHAILADWHGPVLFVQYNRLVDYTEQTVEMIARFAGVEPNERAIEFIEPSLRHFS